MVEFGDNSFKFILIIVTLLNFILSFLTEKLLVPCISEAWKTRKIKELKNEYDMQINTNLNLLYEIKNNA